MGIIFNYIIISSEYVFTNLNMYCIKINLDDEDNKKTNKEI